MTKHEFYRLWNLGVLGNRPKSWPSVAACRREGFTDRVGLRMVDGFAGQCRYSLTLDEAAEIEQEWGRCNLTEMMPDQALILQGEMATIPGQGWHLHYSYAPFPMRPALRQRGRHASGLTALLLLQGACDASSLDDLRALWELFPGHVVEFSVYTRDVGVIPGRNTIIWEVRDY